MTESKLIKILQVLLTIQWAKELPRQGFINMGFKRNEADSVAAHSFATALLAYIIACELKKEGVKIDPDKTLKMGIFHDMAETIDGVVGTFVKGMAGGSFYDIEREGMVTLVDTLGNKEEILDVWNEYEKRESIEARVVKAADNIDALCQAKGVPGAADALKYFKEVYHITKFPWHKKAVKMILDGKVEPLREWQR